MVPVLRRWLGSIRRWWGVFVLILIGLGVGLWVGLPDQRLVATFAANQSVYTIAISADRQYIAAAGERTHTKPAGVSIWHVPDQQQVAFLPQDGYVTDIAIHPDSTLIAIATEHGRLVVWSTKTRHTEHVLVAADHGLAHARDQPRPDTSASCRRIVSLAFHPQGAYLAVGCDDGVILLINPTTGATVSMVQGHTFFSVHNDVQRTLNATIGDLAFRLDGAFLASGGSNGSISIWRVQDDQLIHIRTFTGSAKRIQHLAWGTHDDIVVGKPFGHEMERWSVRDAVIKDRVYLNYPRVPSQIRAISAAHALVIITPQSDGTGIPIGYDATIYVYDLASQDWMATLRGHRGIVYSAAVSEDGQWVVSGGDDGIIRLWHLHKTAR